MSKASERVKEKIMSGNINYEAKSPKPNKESIFKRIILWPFRTLLSMFALDSAWSSRTGSHFNSRGGYSQPHSHSSSTASFREQHHFNPESWVIKEMQAEAYHSMVDGKGDHDCDHDHDEY